jgi:hypothetical protein
MPEKHTLSKSTYLYGCQCPKRLHLHKYRQDLKNPVDERVQYKKDSGTSVGLLAQQLFPGGVDARLNDSVGQTSPKDIFSYQEYVIKTQELIAQGVTIIYEAVFQYDGALCAVDILVKEGNAWYAYEVKGAGSIYEQYVTDAAFQYYVITNSGLLLDDISIVHLNKKYVRSGELEINKLFVKQSILREVVDLQNSIQHKIAELKNLLTHPEPVQDIGPHCFAPYDCDFTDHCWAHMPKIDSVFDLGYQTAVWKLYAAGYLHLDHIPKDYTLSKPLALQLAHYHSGEPFIDQEAVQKFLSSIHYPVYFLDFETVWPGVPEFDNTHPFQQVPFQFSLHILRTATDTPEHYEFLGDGHADPREAFVHAMTGHLGTEGTILCYNTTFEKSRIKELAFLFPQHADTLLRLTTRMADLMQPFQKRWYYHPEFKGSYSIKNVLPVLCPDLRYDSLSIREGDTASKVYAQLKMQDDDTAALQREHLLAYCKMDTLAMVRILEWLRRIVMPA